MCIHDFVDTAEQSTVHPKKTREFLLLYQIQSVRTQLHMDFVLHCCVQKRSRHADTCNCHLPNATRLAAKSPSPNRMTQK